MAVLERVKPIYVEAEQRSAQWFAARLGNVTGSDADKTFLNISDSAKNNLIKDILTKNGIMTTKTLTPKLKASEDFLELWSRDSLELFDEMGERIPESEERIKYRKRLVTERLIGMPVDENRFITPAMKWGMLQEQDAINEYVLRTKNIVGEAPFLRHPELRCGASPDGLVVDRETGLLGVLEVKCLNPDNHLYEIIKRGEIPDKYIVQIHMEMWISGRDFCDFIGYDPRVPAGLQLFVKRYERDDDYIENVLEPSVRRFLEECDRDERYFRMKNREAREEAQKA